MHRSYKRTLAFAETTAAAAAAVKPRRALVLPRFGKALPVTPLRQDSGSNQALTTALDPKQTCPTATDPLRPTNVTTAAAEQPNCSRHSQPPTNQLQEDSSNPPKLSPAIDGLPSADTAVRQSDSHKALSTAAPHAAITVAPAASSAHAPAARKRGSSCVPKTQAVAKRKCLPSAGKAIPKHVQIHSYSRSAAPQAENCSVQTQTRVPPPGSASKGPVAKVSRPPLRLPAVLTSTLASLALITAEDGNVLPAALNGARWSMVRTLEM